jgi:hypothetical protein
LDSIQTFPKDLQLDNDRWIASVSTLDEAIHLSIFDLPEALQSKADYRQHTSITIEVDTN